MGNPIDEQKQDRMGEIIQEVVGVFAKNFPIAYKDALIQKIKDDAQPSPPIKYYLDSPPTPDYPIKTGNLCKRGETVKSWKNRFFIAYNAEDNYRVDYLESDGGKVKGSIQLCGYHPEKFNDSEAKAESCQYGVKLVPWDDRRRVWYMKCSSENERADWMNTFRTGCCNAQPPTDKDILIATAFRKAYRATRWSYGYYGWYYICGTEAETLGAFVSEILDRELLNEVYASIPNNPAKAVHLASIKASVNTVMASVAASWIAGLSACQSMKAALQGAVKASLSPIFEKEVGIKQHVTEKISHKVNPFLHDVGGRICNPIFQSIWEPFTRTFCATIKGVAMTMRTKIERNDYSKDKLDTAISWSFREVNYWWSGPLEQTNQLCWELYTGKLNSLTSFFTNGYTTYDIYNALLAKNRDLAVSAIYTFGKKVKELEGSVDQMSVLNEVMAQMLHDAKLYEKQIICDIIGNALSQPVATTVTNPCTELVQPIQTMIDTLPGLTEFFNLSNILEDIIASTVSNAIDSIVTRGFEGLSNQIDLSGNEIGVAAAI